MTTGDLAVFAIEASRPFGERVAAALDVPLARHEEREFEDGEHKIRSLESVRGRDIFVIHSLASDEARSVNDKLVRLLVFVGALVDASAARVTAVVPYLAYARKDQRSQPRDPVTTRYVAQLFEAVGAGRFVTIDVHNLAAYQNAFRIPAEHLEARNLFVEHFAAELAGPLAVAVLAPDAGGVKRAARFRDSLERATGWTVPLGVMEKTRERGVMTPGRVVGDVAGRAVVIIDDLISTGGTLASAAVACRELGATAVYAAATHGVFTDEAVRRLDTPALDRVVVTDTIPPWRLPPDLIERKLIVLPAAPLVAEAIRRIHDNGSLVDLLAV